MDGSAAAMLGLLEAFHCSFIPHSTRHTGSARCRLPSGRWQYDGRFWGESPRASATYLFCLFFFFITVLTEPRVGFCHLLARERDATSWHYKKSANNPAGKLRRELYTAQVGGFRKRT